MAPASARAQLMLLAVALILLLLLPRPWDVVAAAAFVLLGIVELYAWNRTVRHRRKVVGVQALVGRTGEVRVACKPFGQVFVAGELWAARCEQGADKGASVKVRRVRGLTLEVQPEP